MATGTVLENLSNRKLCVLLCVLLAIVALCFALGFASPKPVTVMPTLMTPCYDPSRVTVRTGPGSGFLSPQATDSHPACVKLDEDRDIKQQSQRMPEAGLQPPQYPHLQPDQVVFAAEIPRNNHFSLTPWHQFVIALLELHVQFLLDNQITADKVFLDVRLGGRNNGDSDWTEISYSEIQRPLKCAAPTYAFDEGDLPETYPYDCDTQTLFELGSCAYSHYLVNIRVNPKSRGVGNLYGFMMPVLWQNAKYTKILFSLKTVLTPLVMFAMVWFWRRVSQLRRRMELIEKSVLFLGFTALQLDLPLDWLSLVIKSPIVLFVSDMREGLFYMGLLCFWVIFTGEHLIRKTERNNIVKYWKELSAINTCCIALFCFDILERGVQISDPFYTIWSTKHGHNIAIFFIVIGAVCAAIYFSFLAYLVFQVFRTIRAKQQYLASMSKVKRLAFEGVVFRFKFFMAVTLALAAVTVAFFILSQVWENSLDVNGNDSSGVSVTAVFCTGVFGMWNVYAVAALFLYAPSHRNKEEPSDQAILNASALDDDSEEEELPTAGAAAAAAAGPREPSVAAHFAPNEEPSIVYSMLGKERED